MNSLLATCLALPALALIGLMFVPSRFANGRVTGFRRVVTAITLFQFVIGIAGAVSYVAGGLATPGSTALVTTAPFSLPLGIYYDGVAALMLALVSFVGWVICQYSLRYLDGESTQGRYFRWAGFTIGAVSLLVISGNLLMFVVCWIMTSLGLHQLLMHYGHRPAAKRAAWTKFTISRVGDAALLGAIALIYSQFKTLNFAELLTAVETAGSTTTTSVAGFLLVIGAITKSAQFPFHTWLPQTMETPTPVSALMHAGIVNAGGYLIIRTSPLVSQAPWAMMLLAIVGGVTACFGAVVMLTQTSVKKSLAYSTIAQMGFMMLQCGLGAYSAAMLHILAHSLYKAHAFLSSGSVISQQAGTAGALRSAQAVSWIKLALVGCLMIGLFGITLTALGVDIVQKPGGLLLGGILCLALTQWIGQVLQVGGQQLVIRSFAVSGLLCIAYGVAYVAIDATVSASLPAASVIATASSFWLVSAIISIGFVTMFALQMSLASGRPSPRLHRWYVHASNGFYVENLLRRVFGPLAST